MLRTPYRRMEMQRSKVRIHVSEQCRKGRRMDGQNAKQVIKLCPAMVAKWNSVAYLKVEVLACGKTQI